MILGVIPEQGGSISNLVRAGQHTRFFDAYLAAYARAFEEVYYFSYLPESVRLPERCAVAPNPGYHRWAYSLALPLVQREIMRRCSVLRVMQAYGAIPALAARTLYGTPYVMTWGYRYAEVQQAKGQSGLRARLFDARAALGARFAARVIVTTPTMADYVGRIAGARKLALIPNGVDTAAFFPAAAPPAGEPWAIAYVGRLSAEKNVRLLVEAAGRLQALEPARRVRLLLMGEGPEREALRQRAQELGVEAEFAGVVPNDQLPERLQQCHAFVLPSLGEGHPKSLLEAMACGLPCVGTDVAGIRDVIRDGETGLLCALDADDLAARLRLLRANPDLAARLGAAARTAVLEQYDLSRLMQREIALLQEVARESRR